MLTGGNVSDVSVAGELTVEVVGCHVVAGKGYDGDRYRDRLRSNNDTPVIPGRWNRKDVIDYDKAIYKLRRNIELFFGKLKENKRRLRRGAGPPAREAGSGGEA